jgi:cytochrome P450
VCIGNRFAQMEIALVMATMLQDVSVLPGAASPAVPDASMTLRPRDGLRLLVRRRRPPVGPEMYPWDRSSLLSTTA